MADFIPIPSSALGSALVEACGAQSNLRIGVQSYTDDGRHILGVCLDGANKGLALSVVPLDSDVQLSVGPHQVCAYAVENNAFKLPTGTKLVLNVGDDCDEDGVRETIGMAFDRNYTPLHVEVVFGGGRKAARTLPKHVVLPNGTVPNGKRSTLKPVVLPNGTILNRDMSLKAFCTWLNKYNRIYAPAFGVSRLVWCEEMSSSRADRNQVRVFYRLDLTDMRKKPCANVNNAIEAMENIINRNFYTDMRTDGDDTDGEPTL